jgi:hypothetical protein
VVEPERMADDQARIDLGRLDPAFTKLLRLCADTFFAKRYGHRAIVLETVAAVPGMVGATLTHLTISPAPRLDLRELVERRLMRWSVTRACGKL